MIFSVQLQDTNTAVDLSFDLFGCLLGYHIRDSTQLKAATNSKQVFVPYRPLKGLNLPAEQSGTLWIPSTIYFIIAVGMYDIYYAIRQFDKWIVCKIPYDPLIRQLIVLNFYSLGTPILYFQTPPITPPLSQPIQP